MAFHGWDEYRLRDPGFSLVEMLITLAILGLLLAAAAPAFVSMARENRLASEINLLLADIHLARLEAIKRNQDVVLCRSADGRQCTPSSGMRADWSIGWIVYVNADQDKTRDADEPLLRAREGPRPGLRLHFNQWWRVAYHPDGSAKNGTFTLCDPRGAAHARALTLYYTGRPRITDERPGGGPLDCS